MSAFGRRLSGLCGAAIALSFLAACATTNPSANLSPAQAQSAPLPAVAPAALHAPSLKDLTGLDQPEILALLGKPDLRRDEPPAQLWQYRTSDCVLSLFFYHEADGFRLVRAESWRRSLASDTNGASCGDGTLPLRPHPSSAQSSL